MRLADRDRTRHQVDPCGFIGFKVYRQISIQRTVVTLVLDALQHSPHGLLFLDNTPERCSVVGGHRRLLDAIADL
jgi:hypothetical protein